MSIHVVLPITSKDPSAILDYGFDWTAWLEVGETISTSAWAVDVAPDDELEALLSPAPSIVGNITTVWVQGGTVGFRYRVRNRIVSSAGRADDRSFWVSVKDL